MSLIFALIIAVVVAIPWLIASRFTGAVVSGVVAFAISWFWVYTFLPSTAGPLFGDVGIVTSIFLLVFGLMSLARSESTKERIPFFVGLVAIVICALTGMVFSEPLQWKNYAALVTHIENRPWRADFQPKDPRHFRVSSPENAHFLASRAVGQATTVNANGQVNAIGSKFTVHSDVSSIQIIKGELWTIVPLDWSGWGPWFSGTALGVPGYIKVSGENPIVPAEYVSLGSGNEFRFTPESYFGQNLDRLVWNQYPDKYIADKHLEIDDEGKPHYIVSLSEPTIGWWGDKVTGALIIDPVTGSGVDKFIHIGEIPSWVDRVEAQEIVHRNIDLHSKYASGGVWNRTVSRDNVFAATQTHFGYGSGGEPVFATGITSHSRNGSGATMAADSLVAVYYTNTRTGKTVEYVLQGGATEWRAIEQCNLLGDVKNKGYHGTTPQLYNIYGHISYVVPLQNSSNAFAGVAIVDVMNPQVIAWGQSAHEAELAYKQVIVSNSQQMAIDGTRKLSTVTGEVERIGSMLVSGSTTFFIQVKGMDHLLTVPVSTSATVPVTRVGDTVWVEYYDSGETVMPANRFDNKSCVLKASKIETEVHQRAEVAIEKARVKSGESTDVEEALEKLSPEERELLKRKFK